MKLIFFQLVESFEKYRPTSKEDGKPMGVPFPPYWSAPNSGIALDKEGNARSWRLIQGQPSIWVDKQLSLEKETPQNIERMLGDARNIIEFRHGVLQVRRNEALKLEALEVSDYNEGNTNPYYPRKKMFKLLNPAEDISKALNTFEVEDKANDIAKNASEEEVLAFAYSIGIDTSDTSDEGLRNTRLKFRNYAKNQPAKFIELFSNPVNKIKYVFAQAIRDNHIALNGNKLMRLSTNLAVLSLKGDTDVVTQLTELALGKDAKALELYQSLLAVI